MDALTVLTGIAILAGLVGTVVVVVPGLLVVWGAVLVWALLEDNPWRWAVLAVATVLLAASTVLKYLLPGRRLSESGVPGWSIAVAGLVGVVGFFVVPVVGFFLGFVLGLLGVELVRLKDWAAAWPATRKALGAVGLSVAIELFAGLLIAATWLAAVVLG
jgi:uncharacterized protein YqgC (DUF456 family)